MLPGPAGGLASPRLPMTAQNRGCITSAGGMRTGSWKDAVSLWRQGRSLSRLRVAGLALPAFYSTEAAKEEEEEGASGSRGLRTKGGTEPPEALFPELGNGGQHCSRVPGGGRTNGDSVGTGLGPRKDRGGVSASRCIRDAR